MRGAFLSAKLRIHVGSAEDPYGFRLGAHFRRIDHNKRVAFVEFGQQG